MQTQIRKIGNSKGVIIPAAFLAEADLNDNVQIILREKEVVITPIVEKTKTPKKELRKGWFNDYDSDKDIDAWEGFVVLSSEEKDWE
jgi:antitoxin MazE